MRSQVAPRISWVNLANKLAREWEPGQHVTLVGPTGRGKTHLALTLAELCKYVLVIATKRKDPLVTDLGSTHLVTADLDNDVIWTADGTPIHSRIVFWPQFPEDFSAEQRAAAQAKMIREALHWADKCGNWAVLVDELMYAVEQLRLDKALNQVWFQGRTQGVSMIACGQRPARVPRLAFSSATYIFLWKTSDKRDIENLREISGGFPTEVIEASLAALDSEAYECLFIDTLRGDIARVIAPPR